MKSVIEVDINEDDEELMFQQACLGGSISPRVIECEIERDSIEMVEGLDLENE